MKNSLIKRINYIRDFIEVRAFGVCSYLGERMGIPSRYIRLYFLYATFIATWSPVIIYMSMAFILNLRNYIKSKKTSLWDG